MNSTLTAIIEATGWTLVHSLWQVTAIALVPWLVLRLARDIRSAWHYAIGCAAMVGMVAAAGATFLSVYEAPRSDALASSSAAVMTSENIAAEEATLAAAGSASAVSSQSGSPTQEARPSSTGWQALGSSLPWIVAVWVAGVVLLSLRSFFGWLGVRRLRRTAEVVVDPSLLARFGEIVDRLGVTSSVALRVSHTAAVPMVVGWLKPVVLIPASILSGLSSRQLEAIIAHELAHIRRHDYLVNLVQNVVETLFFYHPAVWWVSKQVRSEREHCCDDIAAEVSGGAVVYGRALAALEEMRGVLPGLAVGATGGSLVRRIRRLAGSEEAAAPVWPAVALMALLGSVMVFGVASLSAEPPEASVAPIVEKPLVRTEQRDRAKSPAAIVVRDRNYWINLRNELDATLVENNIWVSQITPVPANGRDDVIIIPDDADIDEKLISTIHLQGLLQGLYHDKGADAANQFLETIKESSYFNIDDEALAQSLKMESGGDRQQQLKHFKVDESLVDKTMVQFLRMNSRVGAGDDLRGFRKGARKFRSVESKGDDLVEYFSKFRKGPRKFRVDMRRHHYLGGDVPGSKLSYCFEVTTRGSGHKGHVFVKRDSPLAEERLRGYLGWSTSHHVVVELEWVREVGGSYVRLKEIGLPARSVPRRPRYASTGITSVDMAEKTIALTFDDGPHPKNTPAILDLLRKHDLKATFFVVGTNARRYPKIMKRMIAEGHEIGNHTTSHPMLTRKTDAVVLEELRRCHAMIVDACGVAPTTMRPPGGALKRVQRELIEKELGYEVIQWSVDPADWRRPGIRVVADRIVENAKPGAIVLMHDIHTPTVAATELAIEGLLAKGFAFATVSELLGE